MTTAPVTELDVRLPQTSRNRPTGCFGGTTAFGFLVSNPGWRNKQSLAWLCRVRTWYARPVQRAADSPGPKILLLGRYATMRQRRHTGDSRCDYKSDSNATRARERFN